MLMQCGHEKDKGSSTTHCSECAHVGELTAIRDRDYYTAYLAGDYLTTFVGGTLLHVVSRRTGKTRYTPSGGRYQLTYLTAVDPFGRTWSGQGLGEGMYVRLRRKVR